MKWIPVFIALFTAYVECAAQNAYIQVKGEPGLSVFLDAQFKGKTTAEYNGLIIENVNAGQHLIKIVRDGYVPYEETIVVKKGEVLAYNVKPFTKHTITISEKGNTENTDKKVEIATGELLVQSVPIEIKITIKGVEGANMLSKTKDEWTADKIPEGIYDIQFHFNGKVVEKKVGISGGKTSKIFVNMINGTVSSSVQVSGIDKVFAFADSLVKRYFFKPGLNREQFLQHYPDLQRLSLVNSDWSKNGLNGKHYYINPPIYGPRDSRPSNGYRKGFSNYIVTSANEVVSFSWALESPDISLSEMKTIYARLVSRIRSQLPGKFWKESSKKVQLNGTIEEITIFVPDDNGVLNYYIRFSLIPWEKHYNISLTYFTREELL